LQNSSFVFDLKVQRLIKWGLSPTALTRQGGLIRNRLLSHLHGGFKNLEKKNILNINVFIVKIFLFFFLLNGNKAVNWNCLHPNSFKKLVTKEMLSKENKMKIK
jgi:hypothetical protein